MERRTIVILGSSGRIGGAAAKSLGKTGRRVVGVSWLDRNIEAGCARQDILSDLATIQGDVDIVFASGLTDPDASADDLLLANVERPIGLIGATIDQSRFRYLTIGSVLETFSSLATTNRYLASKATLWARIDELA